MLTRTARGVLNCLHDIPENLKSRCKLFGTSVPLFLSGHQQSGAPFVPPDPAPNLHAQLEPLDGDNEGIFLLTMHRPDATNAIGWQMVKEMRECMQNLASENTIRCVVLRSALEGVFSAGIDLNEREKMTHRESEEFMRELRDVISSVEGLAAPTIAAVDGYALGSGAELALACDLRLAGENAKIAFPETRLGTIPSCGGTQRLSRTVGRSKAKELLFTGRGIEGVEAESIGASFKSSIFMYTSVIFDSEKHVFCSTHL